MLGTLLQSTENKNAALRLREIVTVLRRHDIVHGLTPAKLRAIFEHLGPTFVKFGQIMSMRPDFLPTEYCDELMKLQTGARPLPFPVILSIVEQEYNREWNKVFRTIDSTPLGSASIAQAHRATLSSGEEVVIKVQRPGIHEIMRMDLTLMKRAATIIRLVNRDNVVDFRTLMDEMWNIAKQEFGVRFSFMQMQGIFFKHFVRWNFLPCERNGRDSASTGSVYLRFRKRHSSNNTQHRMKSSSMDFPMSWGNTFRKMQPLSRMQGSKSLSFPRRFPIVWGSDASFLRHREQWGMRSRLFWEHISQEKRTS